MAEAEGKTPAKRGWLRRRKPREKVADARAAMRRSDLTVAALGVALGLTCALFPWYIFFNQEQFAPSAGGIALVPGLGGGPKLLSPPGADDGVAALDGGVPIEELDLFATGSTEKRAGDEPQAPEPAEQPLPIEPPRFHVVHIENSRAMIEDDSGLFIVGRGDRLPDGSRVARIEKRKGRMVVVTSEDAVLEVTAR